MDRFRSETSYLKFARTCLDNVSPHKFWFISNQYPDLVVSTFKLDCWVILGLVLSYPGQAKLTMLFVLFAKNPTIIFITSFLIVLISVTILIHFGQIWSLRLQTANSADGSHVSSFLTNLDQQNKTLMLVGCLPLPFDSVTVTVLTRFVASAVGKIYKLRTERLHELEAPWLRKAVK